MSALNRLNNYLQRTKREAHLSWEETSYGPPNALDWKVKCKINGQVYGEATSRRKNEAKEMAATMALQRLGQ
ncbi:hypothetical protein DAEQUDRAFT_808897 [Daedalea quercina L-15889]|uniref:DRBM domain-containing protein n=1 Tax=Daedalea quercina L-15889 TaxID=1314783 RepID=A0A165T4X8_9APHY|nr:hypothetical protein DAEQUDRAFT_808897 [Daedalea quercina L-15889]